MKNIREDIENNISNKIMSDNVAKIAKNISHDLWFDTHISLWVDVAITVGDNVCKQIYNSFENSLAK